MQKILSKYPLEILTPENVIAKIGKDFKVLRSDGKMDSGWIVEKCLKLVPHHQHEDEFMVTVVKQVKGQAPLTKTISLGNLKIWNDRIDLRPKVMMSASALSRYLGKTSFNVLRSSGKMESGWMIRTCLRFSEQDNEDDLIVLLVKVDASRTYERKAISLRALKTWNGIQPFTSRARERSPAYMQRINDFIANDPYL
jgi:hypothetical protein